MLKHSIFRWKFEEVQDPEVDGTREGGQGHHQEGGQGGQQEGEDEEGG